MTATGDPQASPAGQTAERGQMAVIALIALLLLLRLIAMALMPLMDTTEARYADIGRRMAELQDWITPWYDDGVPFWGKPPLSFWLTAASFRLLGVSEFAARLPHLLCTAATVALVWQLARRRHPQQALPAAALLMGSIGLLAGAGAVMTDPALVLGTSLAMHGFWFALHAPDEGERRRGAWTFFGGLAIGLLAKGPLALVLVAVPLLLWTVISLRARAVWRGLPWLRGTWVTALLVAPWYLLAEQRTPGFLNYFLLGEHWHRFVTPGWAGDLYGFAHRRAPGTIWLYALLATLPWTVLLPLALRRRNRAAAAGHADPDADAWRRYLLLWALWPLIFFTAARNIIWSYVLPSLPAAALLGAGWLQGRIAQARACAWVTGGLAITAGVSALALAVGLRSGRFDQETARPVVHAYRTLHSPGEPLIFVGRRPFSASFYGDGAPIEVRDPAALPGHLGRQGAFVAARGADAALARESLGGREAQPAGRFGAYELLFVMPLDSGTSAQVPGGKALPP